MEIKAPDEAKAARGPEDWFTGAVSIRSIGEQPLPGRVRAALVSFEAGARTAWHTHPFGQILYIVQGRARVQTAGGEVAELEPGSAVRFDAGEDHWHGAAPGGPMVHVAVQEADEDGVAVTWDRHVTDEEYGSA